MSNDFGNPRFDPRYPTNALDSEEHYPEEDYVMSIEDQGTFITRCIIVLFCFISLLLVFVNVARGTRLKNWRLYCLVGIVMFCWLALSLYQDHIDEYFVQYLRREPQIRSIFWCVRNIVHGLTLYLILLLLSHLSEFQRGGLWLALVASVVVVPLLYSIALIIVDLRIHPDSRYSWEWSIAIKTVHVFLYNVLTTIILIIFSPRFCARRLYSTYEDRRSSSIVLVSRWTFAFLLLHNLTAIAAYGAFINARVPEMTSDVHTVTIVNLALEEASLFFVVLSVPFSYLVGVLGQCCCKEEGEQVAEHEMAKMDKIYQEVWTSNQTGHRKGRNGSVLSAEDAITTNGTNSTRAIAESPGGSVPRREPVISTQPDSGLSRRDEKRRKRESYLEAVSMGSLDGRSSIGGSSITSDPVDL